MRDSRGDVVFRVEIIRDEARGAGAVAIDITAYIGREPDDNEADFGCLSRVPPNAWNTRMLYTGDFAALGAAVGAIAALYPGVDRLNCYEWGASAQSAAELPPLRRTGGRWSPASAACGGQLDWRSA
jgi:hypothetical protein